MRVNPQVASMVYSWLCLIVGWNFYLLLGLKAVIINNSDQQWVNAKFIDTLYNVSLQMNAP